MSKRRGRRVQEGRERVYKGDRIVRVVSTEKAVQLLEQKRAVCYQRPDGRMDGIQLVDGPRKIVTARLGTGDVARTILLQRYDDDARRSCVVLSRAEAEAVADRNRKSRTGNLTDAQREARVKQGFGEMDLVEAARRKFHAMFPEREPEPTFS